MGLAEKIIDNIKTAMKSGDKLALEVLRMLKSDFKYKEIELGREMTENDYMDVLQSAAKKRRDAIEGFAKGGRDDLVAKEKAELDVISGYLPQQLSDEELEEIIEEVMAEVGASTSADIGAVMKTVMPRVKGRADGRKIKEFVSQKLNK